MACDGSRFSPVAIESSEDRQAQVSEIATYIHIHHHFLEVTLSMACFYLARACIAATAMPNIKGMLLP